MADDIFTHINTRILHDNTNTEIAPISLPPVPSLIHNAGPQAQRRFIEFFTADIRNPGTRSIYAHAVRQFSRWCDQHQITLANVSPFLIATYIEQLTKKHSPPTVKQHLSAIRRLCDYLVTGQVIPFNPAASVRGPSHIVTTGKTPVLTAHEARQLLDSINISTIIGLRDRALIAVLVYSFARVSAAIGMQVQDYYPQGRTMWLRLHEKGGKHHQVPAHHNATRYLDAYIEAANINNDPKSPLFRTISRHRTLTNTKMHRTDVLRMIKRRAQHAQLPNNITCHTFRATGITCYLQNHGQLEHAQRLACHSSPKTTKLYDRTSDAISLDEVERIVI